MRKRQGEPLDDPILAPKSAAYLGLLYKCVAAERPILNEEDERFFLPAREVSRRVSGKKNERSERKSVGKMREMEDLK